VLGAFFFVPAYTVQFLLFQAGWLLNEIYEIEQTNTEKHQVFNDIT
jgi:hypothetical protein